MKLTEAHAMKEAVRIARLHNIAVYVKACGIGAGFRVDAKPGTLGCVRVLPT